MMNKGRRSWDQPRKTVYLISSPAGYVYGIFHDKDQAYQNLGLVSIYYDGVTIKELQPDEIYIQGLPL